MDLDVCNNILVLIIEKVKLKGADDVKLRTDKEWTNIKQCKLSYIREIWWHQCLSDGSLGAVLCKQCLPY